MKQISNKEYERYHKYQIDRLYGRILTPDGLHLICAALDYDLRKSENICWKCWRNLEVKA